MNTFNPIFYEGVMIFAHYDVSVRLSFNNEKNRRDNFAVLILSFELNRYIIRLQEKKNNSDKVLRICLVIYDM